MTDAMDKLDADIAHAWSQLLAARVAWSRSPNAQTVEAEHKAQCVLDKLLEFRHAVTTVKV